MQYAWMVFVLHVCIRWLVTYYIINSTLGDFTETRIFELCDCEYFLIRTVSMGIGYDLASHCNSHNYHGTPKRRESVLLCELPEIRVSTCVCCVNFQGICVVYPCKVVCFLCLFEVLFLLHMPFIKIGHM